MAEREVEVHAASAGELRLRLLGSACAGCSGGCAGRCSLFATGTDGEFRMARPADCTAAVGQRLRLQIDDASLRRAAWQGYGLAWLGLLVGAAAGYALGTLWLGYPDLLTLLGLLSGTFAAVLFSKRHLPEPRLLPAGQGDSPHFRTSDCP